MLRMKEWEILSVVDIILLFTIQNSLEGYGIIIYNHIIMYTIGNEIIIIPFNFRAFPIITGKVDLQNQINDE